MIGARRLKLGLLASLCVLLVALLPAVASATFVHDTEPFSPLDGSGSGLTLREPEGLAIDEATGNVFVTDANRVAILGGEGGEPAGLMSPFEIPGLPFGENSPASLAYDNSPTSSARGTLYAYDPNSETIKKYLRGPLTEKYELAGEIPAPSLPAGIYKVTLSVDSEGALYVSERGWPAENYSIIPTDIYKFSPSGAVLAKYDFTGPDSTENILSAPGSVAVDDGGDLFVIEGGSTRENTGLYEFPADESGEINPDVSTLVLPRSVSGVAVDPATNRLYAATESGIVEYDMTSHKVLEEFGHEAIRSPGEIAFDSATGRIYVADIGINGNDDVDVFGPLVLAPTTGFGEASNITGTKATLNGSVNPEGIEVKECFFEWGTSTSYGHIAPCKALPPTDSEAHPVSAEIAGLSPNGATYHYRLVAANKNGKQVTRDSGFATADVVASEAATGVDAAGATLNGTVRPEGVQYTSCAFEYGLTSSSGFEKEVSCDPSAAELPADFLSHSVAAALSGLLPNSTYKFRLTATNASGTLSGETLTFDTQGRPQISEIRALEADQDAATVDAKINPVGSGTSYHFEWGPNDSYGHSLPVEFEPYVGEGEQPVLVTAKLSGLSAGTAYHYRLVAHNKAGTITSPDEVLETLDSCGLPEQRCFELVSQADAGPVGQPGLISNEELDFQAASAPGSLIYTVDNGFPGTTKAAEVLYHAERGASGWISTQFAAPILARDETPGSSSRTSVTLGISADLSCAVIAANQPLTPDLGSRFVEEVGGNNLYRRNPDGTYTAITAFAPENFSQADEGDVGVGEYLVGGFSESCGEVVFSSIFRYPGVTALQDSEGEYLYEWDEGTLRSVGSVPGPGGETAVVARAAVSASTQGLNAVSEDGARVFFSAERHLSANPEEVGKQGLFVRENGTSTRDLSLSETSTPDLGATYQWITPSGSRVLFTANAGLTHVSSSEGTDLYEYDLETDRLTDLSATTEHEGAGVTTVLGTSSDGSHVYFGALAQLVPGQGRTRAENVAQGTYSIYGEQNGVLRYVGVSGSTDSVEAHEGDQVSPDGRYLLFQTRANETGYVSGGAYEAYLYDANAASDATVCVSCRQDGEVSATPHQDLPLPEAGGATDRYHRERFLAEENGQALAFFISADRLAPGAVEGVLNVYEWAHGQVFDITAEPPGQSVVSSSERTQEETVGFVGASGNGTDLYFSTPSVLNWEDESEGHKVYDARVGGGFAEPPPPPATCDPNAESSCQAASSQSPPSPGAASALLNGPGNVTPGATKPPVSVPKALTRAQKLAKALKACHAYKAKAKRVSCEKRARRTYSNKTKANAKSRNTAKPRKGGK
jgi:hypothetical protein